MTPLLFAVYGCNGREFSYVILENNGIYKRQNDETATEERQRNGGNRALATLPVYLLAVLYCLALALASFFMLISLMLLCHLLSNQQWRCQVVKAASSFPGQ